MKTFQKETESTTGRGEVRSTIHRLAWLPVWAVLLPALGCGLISDGGDIEGLSISLRETQQAYHAATVQSSDPEQIQNETEDYCRDMDGYTVTVIDSCQQMMGGRRMGMMGWGRQCEKSVGEVEAIALKTRGEVEHYCGDVKEQNDATVLIAICHDHDDVMAGYFDEIDSEILGNRRCFQ